MKLNQMISQSELIDLRIKLEKHSELVDLSNREKDLLLGLLKGEAVSVRGKIVPLDVRVEEINKKYFFNNKEVEVLA